MKLQAIVTTSPTDSRPELREAFAAGVDNDPAIETAIRSGVASALQDFDVLEAWAVAIEVDDAALLAARPSIPTIKGSVTG